MADKSAVEWLKHAGRAGLAFGLLAFAVAAFASEAVELSAANLDRGNIPSLQRGARNFINYCSGCHSAKYVRFKTIGKYLGLSDKQLIDNLMFNAEKTFQTLTVAMPPDEAKRWFGVAPPDLTLMARQKGADYIYNFLHGFYIDPARPTGVDNIVFPGTSMPDVVWELQGFQKAVFSETTDQGVTTRHFEKFETLSPGKLDEKDYDEFVRDTVNFLSYIAEPVRAERRKLGVWVLMFLAFFLIIASMLKKQIWKDVN